MGCGSRGRCNGRSRSRWSRCLWRRGGCRFRCLASRRSRWSRWSRCLCRCCCRFGRRSLARATSAGGCRRRGCFGRCLCLGLRGRAGSAPGGRWRRFGRLRFRSARPALPRFRGFRAHGFGLHRSLALAPTWRRHGPHPGPSADRFWPWCGACVAAVVLADTRTRDRDSGRRLRFAADSAACS